MAPNEFVALVQSRIMEVVAAVDDEDQQHEKAAYSIMA
jgi:hypothetical protein